MIHVERQEEPPDFDKQVRQKGLAFLRSSPSGTKPYPYWRDCLDDLYSSYGGICAYLAIHFERVTGGGVVEHFLPKSKRTDLIYEWSNYRLASSIVNSRKRDHEGILDPFEIENGWFHLELVSGRIYPNPGLDRDLKESIQATIDGLGLDEDKNRDVRVSYFSGYFVNKYFSKEYFKKKSPFVYYEAERQGLL